MTDKHPILYRHREACSGCSACAAVCSHRAIRMEQDGMGFRYPVIDDQACVHCGLCEQVCAFRPVVREEAPEAEAVRFPDYLAGSQSGGVGYALMRRAVAEGMLVYGAAMDADFTVRHRRVETMEGLAPLRLSKYVQSDMDGIPAQVLEDLKEGRRVLFTGTPCQCAGVASLCGKYRERLLLADLICHSVPAPAVWKGFLGWSEAKQGGRLQEVLFRDPSLGWHNARTLLVFESGERAYSDAFNYLFMKGMVSRPSCGACPFATTKRPSDITIGDCWGVEKVIPGFADDDRGCSLVLFNTPRGRAFYAESAEGVVNNSVDLQSVLQPSLRKPLNISPLAKWVEKDFLRKGFPFIWKRYGEGSWVHKITSKWKKVKRRFHV